MTLFKVAHVSKVMDYAPRKCAVMISLCSMAIPNANVLKSNKEPYLMNQIIETILPSVRR